MFKLCYSVLDSNLYSFLLLIYCTKQLRITYKWESEQNVYHIKLQDLTSFFFFQVPGLWWALSSCRGPANWFWPHWPVIHDCAERIRLLVPQRAQSWPWTGLLFHGQEGLFCSMSLNVLQPAGADLYPILHRRRLHRLSVRNALHLSDISHWCYQVWMAKIWYQLTEHDSWEHFSSSSIIFMDCANISEQFPK